MRKAAIIIGIDEYSNNLPSLSCCASDAEHLCEMLKNDKFDFSVHPLINGQATRNVILKLLDRLMSSSLDLLLFYFSGHGTKNISDTYICTYESEEYNAGISFSELKNIFTQSCIENPKAIVVLLDCCYSGAAKVGVDKSEFYYTYQDDAKNKFNTFATGRVVYAACGPLNLAFENTKLRSAYFSEKIFKALSGEAVDSSGKITVSSIWNYISNNWDNSQKQLPIFSGDVSGNIIIGDGFDGIHMESIPIQEITSIITQAKAINSSAEILILNNRKTPSAWKDFGYYESSQGLSDKMRWYNSQMERPGIKSNPELKNLYEEFLLIISELGALRIGTSIKHGSIEKILGSGTFGTVYYINSKSSSSSLDPQLAYKLYHTGDLRVSEKVSRFRRGFNAMNKVNHEHIVKVYDITECPLGFYMTYIDGANIRDVTGITFENNLEIINTIADTLRHTHSREVIHRDIKPENIILKYNENGNWIPYLTDFDLAWFSTATQVTSDAFGTIIYASPEQIKTPKSSTSQQPTTDVYSFGQLLYFIFTRQNPDIHDIDSNERHLIEEVSKYARGDVTTKIANLYIACTKIKPEDRIQSFSDISDAIFTIKTLSKTNPSERLDPEVFYEDLLFSLSKIVGHKITVNNSFMTRSNKFSVDLRLENDLIVCEITSNGGGLIPGMSHEEARKTLNKRLDSALKSISIASRCQKKGVTFGEIINISCPNKLDYNFVDESRKILTSVIDVLERA